MSVFQESLAFRSILEPLFYRFKIYLFSKETANLLNLYLAFLRAHITLTICFLNLAKLCHYHNQFSRYSNAFVTGHVNDVM